MINESGEEEIKTMKGHGHAHKRLWIVLGGVAVLIAGHGIILYYFSSHAALSAAIVSGLLVLAVVKHWGLLRALHALLRKTRSW